MNEEIHGFRKEHNFYQLCFRKTLRNFIKFITDLIRDYFNKNSNCTIEINRKLIFSGANDFSLFHICVVLIMLIIHKNFNL